MLKKILAVLAAIGGFFSAIFYVLFRQAQDQKKLAENRLEQEQEKLETAQAQIEAQQTIATKVKEQEQQNEQLKTESKKGDGINTFNAGINRLQNAAKKGQERNSEDTGCWH